MSKNTLILLAVLILLGAVYWFFFMGTPITTTLSVTAPPDPAEQHFLDLASKLNSINFDTALFTDPRFLSLRSLETAIQPEAQGRIDPFAALGH
jgi:hypothetical protein